MNQLIYKYCFFPFPSFPFILGNTYSPLHPNDHVFSCSLVVRPRYNHDYKYISDLWWCAYLTIVLRCISKHNCCIYIDWFEWNTNHWVHKVVRMVIMDWLIVDLKIWKRTLSKKYIHIHFLIQGYLWYLTIHESCKLRKI